MEALRLGWLRIFWRTPYLRHMMRPQAYRPLLYRRRQNRPHQIIVPSSILFLKNVTNPTVMNPTFVEMKKMGHLTKIIFHNPAETHFSKKWQGKNGG